MPLPEVDPVVYTQLEPGKTPPWAEIVEVGWNASLSKEWYATFPVDAVTNPSGYGRLATSFGISGVQARFNNNQYMSVPRTSDIGDDSVTLDFWDGDRRITDLYEIYGEGSRVRVYQFVPSYNLGESPDFFQCIFTGFMKAPKEADGYRFKVDATTGFRSANLYIPTRVVYPGCQTVFGGLTSPVDGTPFFDTMAKINEHNCRYDRHLGGTRGLEQSPGVPFTFCPQKELADCEARFGPAPPPKSFGPHLPYWGFDVLLENEYFGGGSSQTQAITRANEGALSKPLRVVAGIFLCKDLLLLAYQPQSGGKNPEAGFLKCLFAVCEGPIVGIGPAADSPPDQPDASGTGVYAKNVYSTFVVNQQHITCEHVWFGWGLYRQGRNDFTPNAYGYSRTVVCRVNYGRGDFRQFQPDSLTARCRVTGYKNVAVFTDASTHTRRYTTSRAWWLLEMRTNKDWGEGLAHSQFEIADWIALDSWCNQLVKTTDESGAEITIPRTTFNAEITEEKLQEHIRNLCRAGRFSLPFTHDDKIRIVPLDENEVPYPFTGAWSGPTFTEGENIVEERGVTSLKWSRQSNAEVPYGLRVTFYDSKYDFVNRPVNLTDRTQQMLTGRAGGDASQRKDRKTFAAYGVTNLPEAARLAELLLNLGEFDSGGIKNNFKITFRTWSVWGDGVRLYPYRVIRVISPKINRYVEDYTADAGEPFKYEFFRITKLVRRPDLQWEVTAQLYPRGYLRTVAAVGTSGGSEGDTNPGGLYARPPVPATLANFTATAEGVSFDVQ